MPVGYSPEFILEAHNDMPGYWQKGELKVSECQVFEFEDGLKVIEHITAGKVEGKVVVRINS